MNKKLIHAAFMLALGTVSLDASAVTFFPSFPMTITAGGGYFLTPEGDAIPAPIPEASSCAMVLAGLGLVGFAVRRRKRAD